MHENRLADEGRTNSMRGDCDVRPRAWSCPGDVEPGSGAGQQLALLYAFRDGNCAAPDFARGWLDARRVSMDRGECVRGSLEELFDRVFMLIEDYAFDPSLRDPGDLTDEDVSAGVGELLARISRLPGYVNE